MLQHITTVTTVEPNINKALVQTQSLSFMKSIAEDLLNVEHIEKYRACYTQLPESRNKADCDQSNLIFHTQCLNTEANIYF